MLPGEVPTVPLYRGDTAMIADLTFMQDETTPYDLTEYTWLAQWRLKADDPEVIEFNTTVVMADNNARILVEATADMTAAMRGNGVWDLQSTKDGVVRTWVKGKTTLARDVSRA